MVFVTFNVSDGRFEQNSCATTARHEIKVKGWRDDASFWSERIGRRGRDEHFGTCLESHRNIVVLSVGEVLDHDG